MSAFYDLASLVLVPSGYKASKVYAQKPLTTDGQLTFSRASTATRVNASGLIETVASNVPRLDYTDSTCPKLLLEPQRTNILTYSEAFNVGWTATNSTVTTDVTTAPNGVSSADKITANTSNAIHYISKSSADTSASWTYSVFAKAAGYDRIILNTFNTNYVGFNLTTGVVESSLGTGIASASIQNYGNGWYRCSITSTSLSSGSAVAIAIFNAAYTNGNTNPIFTGNGTDGVFIWGAQFEAGAYPTSYISTEAGSAVTRVADACSKTGISSLIGQTEGTVFLEFKRVPKGVNYQAVVSLQGASPAYLIEMYFGTSNTLLAAVYNSGAQFQAATSALSEGTYKAALAYKENDFAFYLNGVQISTDNSGTVPALSTYNLGDFTYAAGYPQADGINQALLFKTRLTNAQLAELTTL